MRASYRERYCNGMTPAQDERIRQLAGTMTTAQLAREIGAMVKDTEARLSALRLDRYSRAFDALIAHREAFVLEHLQRLGVDGCAEALDLSSTHIRCIAYKVGLGKTAELGAASKERYKTVRSLWAANTLTTLAAALGVTRSKAAELAKRAEVSNYKEDLSHTRTSRLMWMVGDEARVLAGESGLGSRNVLTVGHGHCTFDGARLILLHELTEDAHGAIEHASSRPKGMSLHLHMAPYLAERYDEKRAKKIMLKYGR